MHPLATPRPAPRFSAVVYRLSLNLQIANDVDFIGPLNVRLLAVPALFTAEFLWQHPIHLERVRSVDPFVTPNLDSFRNIQFQLDHSHEHSLLGNSYADNTPKPTASAYPPLPKQENPRYPHPETEEPKNGR